jgi:phosphoglycerol transferase
MTFYSHLSPYVHESDLRWSYGAVKGRPNAAWQADLSDKPAEDLVDAITEKGFDGIYIDRFGYPDRGVKLEGELGELLMVEPVVSPDGRKSFFNLLPYKERLQSRTPPRSPNTLARLSENLAMLISQAQNYPKQTPLSLRTC